MIPPGSATPSAPWFAAPRSERRECESDGSNGRYDWRKDATPPVGDGWGRWNRNTGDTYCVNVTWVISDPHAVVNSLLKLLPLNVARQ